MDIPSLILTNYWSIAGHLLYWPVLIWAVLTAPWKRLLEIGTNYYFGVCVGVFLIWQMKAQLDTGLSLHLLGATLMTLMFGWQLSLIGMALVLGGTTINASLGWAAFGVNGIVSGVVPVFISYCITVLVFRRLPKNFFIYIFISGYVNAAITLAIVVLVSTSVLVGATDQTFGYITKNYFAAYLMIMFPEAFITGTLLTLLVAYYPKGIMSFNDSLYLKN